MITTGYYGKTAARGDFVSHRLPQTFINVWDDWAQQLVVACQQNNPDNFDQAWYRLPTYRFAFSAGLAGEHGWLGILIPSTDSVGRKFPLCFARPLNSNALPNHALLSSDVYYQDIENLIGQLMTSDYDFSQLASDLDAIDQQHQPAAEQSDGANTQTTLQTKADSLCLRLSARLNDSQAHLDIYTNAILVAACGSYSMWVTSDISTSSAETLLFEGLPGQDVCSALFDGQFTTPQWSNVVVDTTLEQTRASPPLSVAPPHPPEAGEDQTILPASPAGPIVADVLEFDDDDEESTTVPWDK